MMFFRAWGTLTMLRANFLTRSRRVQTILAMHWSQPVLTTTFSMTA
ncbi:hypothetical protein X778_10195 [Pseudomonas aeruginosa VRFPA07]|nr:hypothetical protein X778_10195 [Pseudomonas aeruginosa VRFPA07]